MKKLLWIILPVFLAGCELTEEQQLAQNHPIKIGETNGVTVWRLIDGVGSDIPVYFSTPTGDNSWVTGGKSKTYHMVPNFTLNNKPVFLEDSSD